MSTPECSFLAPDGLAFADFFRFYEAASLALLFWVFSSFR